MAEQHAHRCHPPHHISRNPFESDPTALPGSTPNPYAAEYDMHAAGHGLPAVDFNPCRPRALRDTISPDQRLSPANTRSVVAPSLVHQPFESGPMRNPASVRPFSSRIQPNPYQRTQTYASTYPSAPLASSNLNEAGSHRSYTQPQPQMQMHAPEIAHHNQSSFHGSPAQRAGAPTDTHLTNPNILANETEDLLFPSYALAKAERDMLFLQPLEIDGDDVEEVDQHKSKYVLDIKKALNRKDFLPPPKSKNPTKKDDNEMSEVDKAKWVKWQKKGQQDFETHLSKPKFEAAPQWSETEFRAWEVVTEIIEIHRQGFEEVTKKKNDKTLNCSARITEAVRVIEGYSRVRHKILVGDKLYNFCISPQAYVEVTIAALWNNSGRPHGTKTSVSDAVPSQQVAKKDESVAHGPGKGRKRKENKESAKTKGNGPVGTVNSVDQEPTSGISSGNIADFFLLVNAEGADENEDAECEIDDDAIAAQLGNNDVPIFNSVDHRGNIFSSVQDDLSLRQPLHHDDTYSARFGNISAPMSPFHPQTQPNPHGSGMSGAFGPAAQPSPRSLASHTTFSATDFGSYVNRIAGHAQSNIMYPPYGLPTTVSYPENITDSNMTGRANAGLPNTQGSQSGVRENPTPKRRRL